MKIGVGNGLLLGVGALSAGPVRVFVLTGQSNMEDDEGVDNSAQVLAARE